MSKNQKPMVGTRIPQVWVEQIQAIAQETGKTQSQVVYEAIASYLGQTDVNSVSAMNVRITSLEKKLQNLVEPASS